MNIQRLPSGGALTNVADQAQRSTRTPCLSTASPSGAKTAAPVTTTPSAAIDVSQRLANYASNIDARLSTAIASGNNTPDQQMALEKAQEQFHSMIQRLDYAFRSGGQLKNDMTIGEGRDKVLEHLASAVNRGLPGSKLDVSG